MLKPYVALTLGLWTLPGLAFAVEPSLTAPPNQLPLAQVAVQVDPSHAPADLLPAAVDLGMAVPLQLLLPDDNAHSRPRKEDWLESNGQWRHTAWTAYPDQPHNHAEDAGLQKAR